MDLGSKIEIGAARTRGLAQLSSDADRCSRPSRERIETPLSTASSPTGARNSTGSFELRLSEVSYPPVDAYVGQAFSRSRLQLPELFATADRLYRAANRRHKPGKQSGTTASSRPTVELDVVEQFETAIVERAKSLASYNASIASLSECKGTLLTDHHIFVLEPGRSLQRNKRLASAARR